MYAHINKPTLPVFQLGKVLKSHEHIAIRLRTTLLCSIECHQTDLVEFERVGLVRKLRRTKLMNLHKKVLEVLARRNSQHVANM